MKLFLEMPEDIIEQLSLNADGILADRPGICAQLSTHINSEFEDMLCDDDDTYLRDICDDYYVFGAENPDSIRSTAREWNDKIRNEALDAIRSMDITDAESLPMDDTTTYRLKKAVLALNNDFYPFADRMVLIDNELGSGFMTPQLPDKMTAQAERNPERYCITHIFPK